MLDLGDKLKRLDDDAAKAELLAELKRKLER